MLVFWIWLSLCWSFCSFADVASWQDRSDGFTSFWCLTALMRNTFLICNHVSMSQTCHQSRVTSQFLHCREKMFNKPFCVIDTTEVISVIRLCCLHWRPLCVFQTVMELQSVQQGEVNTSVMDVHHQREESSEVQLLLFLHEGSEW